MLRMQIESDEMFNLSVGSSTTKKSNIPFLFHPLRVLSLTSITLQKSLRSRSGCRAKRGVLAIAKGTVILSTWSLETGYTIAIQHEEGFLSVYKHNSKLLKRQGEFVNSGDVIAIIGNSGELTTGPHLHFELWHHGATVDPAKYIKF